MSFTFKCPHCNVKLEAEDDWIGMEAECPGCGNNVTITKPVMLKIIKQTQEIPPMTVYYLLLNRGMLKHNAILASAMLRA